MTQPLRVAAVLAALAPLVPAQRAQSAPPQQPAPQPSVIQVAGNAWTW